MIHASVAGVHARFILDTGSTDHVWTTDLANQAGIDLLPAEPGTDHAGAATRSWTIGKAVVEIENAPILVADVVAIEGPSTFVDWGVGGFLSPQHLSVSAWAVIDVVGNRLRLVEGAATEILSWLDDGYPRLRRLPMPRLSKDLIVVEAAIEPFSAVPTMLNTGTDGTEFALSAVPDLGGGGKQRRVGRGLSGADISGRVVEDQVLRVGDATFKVPTLLVPTARPDPPGVIGMDVLAGSVLAVSPDSTAPVQWCVPNDRTN